MLERLEVKKMKKTLDMGIRQSLIDSLGTNMWIPFAKLTTNNKNVSRYILFCPDTRNFEVLTSSDIARAVFSGADIRAFSCKEKSAKLNVYYENIPEFNGETEYSKHTTYVMIGKILKHVGLNKKLYTRILAVDLWGDVHDFSKEEVEQWIKDGATFAGIRMTNGKLRLSGDVKVIMDDKDITLENHNHIKLGEITSDKEVERQRKDAEVQRKQREIQSYIDRLEKSKRGINI